MLMKKQKIWIKAYSFLPLLCEASPPALATHSFVSSLAACSPLSSCGAEPPFLATLSFVSSSADANPLLSDDMVLPVLQGINQVLNKKWNSELRTTV